MQAPLESLTPNRAQAFEAIGWILQQVTIQQSGQDPLFQDSPQPPSISDWPLEQKLANEYHAIGFYLSSDPFHPYEYLFQTPPDSRIQQGPEWKIRVHPCDHPLKDSSIHQNWSRSDGIKGVRSGWVL